MRRLSRRTILRGALGGAAVAIGLPALNIMLDDNGTAHADGAPLPVRFGVWFFGGGVRIADWVPAATGTGWAPGAELMPLAAVRDWVSVVSGCEVKTPFHPHHSGSAAILTGGRFRKIADVRDTIASTVDHPSVDQVAALAFEGTTPFRSLEIGISSFHDTDEGDNFTHATHSGPNAPIQVERSPSAVFARLFGGGPPAPTGPSPRDLARASVLDAITEQARALQMRVGATDRERLAQHLDSIRALETRLTSTAVPDRVCDPGTSPTDVPEQPDELLEEKNRVMSDLLVTALACDMTRAFHVTFSQCGSYVRIWQVGATRAVHPTAHDGDMETIHHCTVFTMEQFAYLLERLHATPEGDGNLLDHCSILCTTEHTEGNVHSVNDFPIVIAGKGGGRLVGGVHYRSASSENVSKALLTALRGAGLPLTEFGYDEGRVGDGISALET